MGNFSNEVIEVVEKATAFAGKRHYGAVGREHLLLAFADGSGGHVISDAFKHCGLTPDLLTSAIEYIDGPKRPHQAGPSVKYVHKDRTIAEPYTQGITTLLARRIFPGLTPNTDEVFQMARREAGDEEITVEKVFRIFLRELGRSDDNRRVMQVLDRAAPGTTIDDIKSAMVEALESEITKMEARYGKVIVVTMSTLDANQMEIVRLKHVRHSFMYTGRLQGA